MRKQVEARIVLHVALDDPRAVSDAACAMYASMEPAMPGAEPLPAALEHDLRAMPGWRSRP